MKDSSVSNVVARPDWRGWIALAWVIGWGWAYGMMAFHARAPQALAWFRTIRRWL